MEGLPNFESLLIAATSIHTDPETGLQGVIMKRCHDLSDPKHAGTKFVTSPHKYQIR